MADVLSTPAAPALSATSDMPALPAAQTETANTDTPTAESGEAGGAQAEADPGVAAAEEGAAAEAAAAAEEAGEQQDGGKPPKKGISGRFSELTAKAKDADARAAAANENVTRLTTALETQSKQLSEALDAIKTAGGSKEGDAIQAAQDADPRPKREAFDHPDQYEESLVQWSVRQGARTAAAEFERKLVERDQAAKDEASKTAEEQAKADEKRKFDETTKAWGERRAEVIKQIPDYEAVAESPDVMVTPHMGAMIIHSDIGPQIAYHLGKNPQEAARIAALPVPEQIFEMGRISAIVSSAAASKPKPPPEPITRTGPRAAAAKKSVDEMSGDEYYEQRSVELRARRN